MIACTTFLHDHHFADAVGVVFGEGEGIGDGMERARVGHQGGEPCHAGGEQGERVVRLVVCPAHIEDGKFLAAHGGDFEGHHGGGVYAGEDHAAAVTRGADGGIGGVLLGGAID